jgi:putative transposase
MARALRIEYVGAVYHATSRGNEKKAVFLDDEDRISFLEILEEVTERFRWLCHAYCLMDNHYHLLIETPEGNLSKGMKHLNGMYTQAFNRKNHRVGHLFQGRYKAVLIEKESHLLEVARYVVLNPVRAKMVENPSRWKWSSYKATAGFCKTPDYLTVDWVLGRFGKDSKIAEKGYRKFVSEGMKDTDIWKHVRGQMLLGGIDFANTFKEVLKEKRDSREIPKLQRYIDRPDLSKIFTERLLRKREQRDEMIVRSVMQYGYDQAEVANYLGIHYSTVSKIVKRRK